MQIRNKQDFWSGVMFVLLGLGFAWKATSYTMGTAARMGPGYFPHWLGILMAIIGAFIALSALRPKAQKTEIAAFDFKILGIIILAVVVVGLLLAVYLPVFNIYAEQDHLVPPSASRPLKQLAGTKDYTELAFKGGHIGIYVSGRAQREVPSAIHGWLAAR